MHATSIHSIYDSYIDALPNIRLDDIGTEMAGDDLSGWNGYINRMMPRPGLEIVDSFHRFQDDHAMRFRSEAAMVELSFCLQGTGEVAVSGGSQHDLVPDSCSLQLMRDFQADFCYMAQAPFRSVAIGISVELFNEWLAQIDEGTPYTFESLLGNRPFRMFRMPLRPDLMMRLQQLIAPPASQPRLRRLHAEGKTLEIAAHVFDMLLFEREAEVTRPFLSRSDREKIHSAREILLANMEAPPSLIELARMAQLNEYKLKIGFKEEFGTSVFAYLREKRLEKALELLRLGEMNVSQVALSVGFSNFSHFSEAFRKQYGMNPSDVKRGRYIL
ncbi:AraC family transcriptional regulator [Brevibacillus sp. HD1.4A]|uniref:helix-turn-helix transcriptional regulator n=1 Tax=Brevibacillus sp. HD1.4A TaxID=2738978 RepID=UPI00156ACBB7|nr:AraC family transcriptional regulator [Brevibacillus sp. HD1.4A]NRQ55742.1 helix-turn-helix transcriptional regulator [Brevibacillus sp. HD1.4A]